MATTTKIDHECDAKAVFGTHEPACSKCVHHACPYFERAFGEHDDEIYEDDEPMVRGWF